MSGSSRLEMLHFARRIAIQQIEQIDRWIADEERRETERRTGEERRAAATPGWRLGLTPDSTRPEELHVGTCSMTGQRQRRTITTDQARELLAQGVAACEFCRPDTELGIL